MKKFFSLLATLSIAISSFAQIGFVAGVTSSSSDIKAAIADVKNITKYHVGVEYKIPITDWFAVQTGVLYNVKGTAIGDWKTIALENLKDFNMSSGYIEVPVQLQLGYDVLPGLRVIGFGEPFIGYAVVNRYDSLDEVKKDWDNIKNRLEFGVAAGAGIEFMKHFQLTAKYFWNIGEVYDSSYELLKDAIKGPYSGISASLCIFF